MLEGFREDVDRYRVGHRANTLKLVAVNQGLWALFVYRLFKPWVRAQNPFVRKLARATGVLSGKAVEALCGILLPLDAEIGPGLYIAHAGGIIVNATVKIGRNCTLMHGVTIGNAGRWDRVNDAPVIGDRVYIGAGACVLGGITVGNDAVIGANAVLMKSIEPRAMAVGAPAKVVSHRGSFHYVAYNGMFDDPERIASEALAQGGGNGNGNGNESGTGDERGGAGVAGVTTGGEQAEVDGYDEFSMFADNASEVGLPWKGQPKVSRVFVDLPNGLKLSALVWGDGEPELVLLHGGAQNAHTWDTVALALDVPLVAIDLPGHGRSDWRPQHDYEPASMADDVAFAMRELAPRARAVVGMSLGGLTSIALAARHPDLVRRLGVVDVTPGTDHVKAEPIVAFVSGPEHFDSYDDILRRTVEYTPLRSESSLRRGVLHNARPLPDGRWTWRYDPARNWKTDPADGVRKGPDFSSLWNEVDRVNVPITLYRGGRSQVVGDEDVDELKRRQPGTTVIVVPDAGHSIQGDKPVELAALLRELLA
jgi:serine acetyltransferase/pimeloyl-ACP methyl ester carboxylesterase